MIETQYLLVTATVDLKIRDVSDIFVTHHPKSKMFYALKLLNSHLKKYIFSILTI